MDLPDELLVDIVYWSASQLFPLNKRAIKWPRAFYELSPLLASGGMGWLRLPPPPPPHQRPEGYDHDAALKLRLADGFDALVAGRTMIESWPNASRYGSTLPNRFMRDMIRDQLAETIAIHVKHLIWISRVNKRFWDAFNQRHVWNAVHLVIHAVMGWSHDMKGRAVPQQWPRPLRPWPAEFFRLAIAAMFRPPEQERRAKFYCLVRGAKYLADWLPASARPVPQHPNPLLIADESSLEEGSASDEAVDSYAREMANARQEGRALPQPPPEPITYRPIPGVGLGMAEIMSPVTRTIRRVPFCDIVPFNMYSLPYPTLGEYPRHRTGMVPWGLWFTYLGLEPTFENALMQWRKCEQSELLWDHGIGSRLAFLDKQVRDEEKRLRQKILRHDAAKPAAATPRTKRPRTVHPIATDADPREEEEGPDAAPPKKKART